MFFRGRLCSIFMVAKFVVLVVFILGLLFVLRIRALCCVLVFLITIRISFDTSVERMIFCESVCEVCSILSWSSFVVIEFESVVESLETVVGVRVVLIWSGCVVLSVVIF